MATEPEPKVSDPFDDNVKLLLQTAIRIHDYAHGSMSNEKQLWINWTEKFFAAYSKSLNKSAFHQMFLGFFEENRAHIAQPIFVEDKEDEQKSTVNDAWLKSTAFLDGPGVKAS